MAAAHGHSFTLQSILRNGVVSHTFNFILIIFPSIFPIMSLFVVVLGSLKQIKWFEENVV